MIILTDYARCGARRLVAHRLYLDVRDTYSGHGAGQDQATQDAKHPGSLDSLPASARQVADNYNHLMEQPTIFYAVCFALQFLDQTQPINIGLAWAYVGLRALHSLVQCTVNIVPLRFLVFSLSTLALFALTVHALMGTSLVPGLSH